MDGGLAIGVDLGTSFSACAYVDKGGKPQMLPNAEGQYLTPSVMYCDPSGIVIGQAALDAGLIDGARFVQSVKRHMSDEEWRFKTPERAFSAVELSAEILRKLKDDASSALGEPVRRAVVTVPAYFGESERRATESAARMAGLELLRLINEPTAAAVAYGVERGLKPETLLFYDLGGGTFDVTVCRTDKEEIHVLASNGYTKLGGKDFDQLILESLARSFQSEHGVDPLTDSVSVSELLVRAIRAKHQLTSMERAKVLVAAHGKHSSVDVTREQFEQAGRRLMRHTQVLLNEVITDAGLGLGDIDKLILVGGSSRMPMVKRTLEGYLRCPILMASNPDEIVALGAAIIADRIVHAHSGVVDENVGSLGMVDVLSHSIGVQVRNTQTGKLRNRILIRKNTSLPHETVETFVTDADNRTSLRIVVYQGEFDDPADCVRVGEFVLSGLPPGRPRGRPVDIFIKCNVSGIVEIHAIDQETGLSAMTSVNYG